jgi:carboxymethylenebutenolidase
MTETVKLTAADGHQLDAYIARPTAEPIAGLVVIQEIFGVNQHIRSIADSYAHDGFLAIAPALFDRVERNVELPYDGPQAKRGMEIKQKLSIENSVTDVNVALQYVRQQTGKKSGVIGYCYGGLLAWLSATRLNPDAAVGYYAGGIGNYASEIPHAPIQLHFGKLDTHIPAEQVEKIQAAHPEVQIYWYENAGHGFNCDMRSSYNPEAAAQARTRALAFLKQNLT